MRMRDQLVVVVAVLVATIAVAANVFAQTRAADQRVEMAQAGLAAAWSYPAMVTTTATDPPNEAGIPTDRAAVGDEDLTPRGESPTPPDDASAPCHDEAPCTFNEVLEPDFRNHGQMVRAYVRALGFEEGLDGPRGPYIRQLAKPDIENDGPPRSDRSGENQGTKDSDTQPGRDEDHNRAREKDDD